MSSGGRPPGKTERRVALERVRGYYESELKGLLAHVESAIDGYRAGEIDVHEVDAVIHRYKKAARRLWVFCWGRGGGSAVIQTAALLDLNDPELGPGDWWAAAEPRR